MTVSTEPVHKTVTLPNPADGPVTCRTDASGREDGVVTIADVARRAGVAPSTVSYALSGKRAISERTRARVEESARALGYDGPPAQRRARTRRSDVLGLLMPVRQDCDLPVLMRFVASVAAAARAHAADVLLLTRDTTTECLRMATARGGVDGLVVMDVELHDSRAPMLRELDRPSVLIGFPVDPSGLTCVDLDFTAAGARCLEHLAELGHRHIALLGAPKLVYHRDTGYAHRVMAGFTSAAMRHGVHAQTRATDSDRTAVLRTLTNLLQEQPQLTALVVHNEAALPNVLDCLRELDLAVPEDMSVVALCPDEHAEGSAPRLTSVHLPAEELGAQAVELLVRKMAGDPPPALTLLAPRLTERASVRRREAKP